MISPSERPDPQPLACPHRCFPSIAGHLPYGVGRVLSRRSPAHGGAGCPKPTEGRSPGQVPADAVSCTIEGKQQPHHRLGQIAPLRSLLSSNGVPSRKIANMIVSIRTQRTTLGPRLLMCPWRSIRPEASSVGVIPK